MEDAPINCTPLQHSNAVVAAARMHTTLGQQHAKTYATPKHHTATRERAQLHNHCQLHNTIFAYICTIPCTHIRNDVKSPKTRSVSADNPQLHAKHCKPPQGHTSDSAHATSHAIQLHTSIALAAMPWRSGNNRQRTTRPTPPTTDATHTPTSKCHLATPTAPPHTPLRARHHNTPNTTPHPMAETSQTGHPTAPQGQLAAATNIANKTLSVAYRGSSQLSKTRSRLTTPHDQYKDNKLPFPVIETRTSATHQPCHARRVGSLHLATPLLS